MNKSTKNPKNLRKLLGNYKKNMAHILLHESEGQIEKNKEQKKEWPFGIKTEVYFSEWKTKNK